MHVPGYILKLQWRRLETVEMPDEKYNRHKLAALSFLLPFFFGGTFYAFVAVDHIKKYPHQLIDFVLAVPFAYITLGTCCGIFCFCFWQMAEGFHKAIRAFFIRKDDAQKHPELRSYSSPTQISS